MSDEWSPWRKKPDGEQPRPTEPQSQPRRTEPPGTDDALVAGSRLNSEELGSSPREESPVRPSREAPLESKGASEPPRSGGPGSPGGGGSSGGSSGGGGRSGGPGGTNSEGSGNRNAGRAVAILALVVVLVGAGFVVWYFYWPFWGPDEEPVVIEEFDEQGTRSVTLYFGNAQGEGLVSERRTIEAQVHRDAEVEAVVRELLRGPTAPGAIRTWPRGTRLRSVYYDDEQRLLYLDFNSALVTGDVGGSTMETMTLSALLRTIAVDFPEVESVQILVDGLEVETLAGHIDLTRPFRTKDWL